MKSIPANPHRKRRRINKAISRKSMRGRNMKRQPRPGP